MGYCHPLYEHMGTQALIDKLYIHVFSWVGLPNSITYSSVQFWSTDTIKSEDKMSAGGSGKKPLDAKSGFKVVQTGPQTLR